MDTTTLVVANGILFALYAGVMLVNARIVGGARGALWFAGSNLLRGIAMLMVGVQWLQLAPARYIGAISAILSVIGTMMLHQAFSELLERGKMMRSVQYALVSLMVAGSTLMMIMPRLEPYLGVALCGVLFVQFAVVSMLVFRFSGEEVGPVGWITGVALAAYSGTFLIRAYAASALGLSLLRLLPWIMTTWLVSCLVTSAVTAFGFMSLSTARLRVELLWRAQVDELTGLLNRWALKRLVMREIARSSRSGQPITIILIDLDGLKLINDSQGHACGDVVLQACAGVLQETVRDQDAVARMGGDEFCVLLPATNLDDALVMAERLRLEVDELVVNYRGETVRSAASLGVASSEICGFSWQSLMDASDAALYRAKRDGKNRVVVARLDDLVSFLPRTDRTQVIREQGNLIN
jgi:diguanylate cyclase (GGDEF)-like protein